jgi:hypothetical protein
MALAVPPRHAALVGMVSGESALAMAIARRDPVRRAGVGRLMQVYRGTDVGIVKPTPAERAGVPHHLLDLADPAEDFAVAVGELPGDAAGGCELALDPDLADGVGVVSAGPEMVLA